MGTEPAVLDLDINAQQDQLTEVATIVLAEARREGAHAAEVAVSADMGLSTTVRKGDVETVEFNRDRGIGITVYFGQRRGSASTSDTGLQALKDTVKAACQIAKYTSEDTFAGLADLSLMAKNEVDLDLYHPWDIDTAAAIELAKNSEEVAYAQSKLITNSEGATVNSHQGCRVYGNSHGFIGRKASTRHSISCVAIAEQAGDMQRDYWYSVARDASDLELAETVGKKAAARTIERLNPQKVKTGKYPVVFSAEIAGGLLSHFMGAISGGSLYRKASFLLDQLGQPIFPAGVQIYEQPYLEKGLASAYYDSDGVATRNNFFVQDGVLNSYVLGTYSARKLGMDTTANAGGVHNLFVSTGDKNLKGLCEEMGTGLLVTELMGQGVNIVTGDYSRGASGFWVENGEIKYPVSEITVAGNLSDIYKNIVEIGEDIDLRSSVRTGSILVESMTVAGE